MAGPLAGIRVADFGRYIAGPYCSALLGDFGADVIRVEKRDGREDRTLIPDFAQEEALSRHALAVLTGQAVGNWTMPALSLDDFTLPGEIPTGLPS